MASTGSSFKKTVCLHDWWLIKYEDDCKGKRLAVEGLTSRGNQAFRVFSSAAIIKRYDVYTLETIDGIVVLIQSLINKGRTEENGFPPEVFNHFHFGFPLDWEKCAAKWLVGPSTSDVVSGSDMGIEKSSSNLEDVASGSAMSIGKPSFSLEDQGKSSDVNSGAERLQDMKLESRSEVLLKNTFVSASEKPELQAQMSITTSPSAKVVENQRDVYEFDDFGMCKSHRKTRNKHGRKPQTGKRKSKGKRLGPFTEPGKNCVKNSSGLKAETSHLARSASIKKTKRKLTYANPKKESEDASIVSPESLSSKRSRSGRLILPTLEFWRNQVAIYDADREIAGIKIPGDDRTVAGRRS